MEFVALGWKTAVTGPVLSPPLTQKMSAVFFGIEPTLHTAKYESTLLWWTPFIQPDHSLRPHPAQLRLCGRLFQCQPGPMLQSFLKSSRKVWGVLETYRGKLNCVAWLQGLEGQVSLMVPVLSEPSPHTAKSESELVCWTTLAPPWWLSETLPHCNSLQSPVYIVPCNFCWVASGSTLVLNLNLN